LAIESDSDRSIGSLAVTIYSQSGAKLVNADSAAVGKAIAWRLRNTIAPGARIVMYHCVAKVDLDPWGLCVTPQHFDEHLEVLKKSARVISLQQLTQELDAGKSVDRSIAITFDDGYADNLLNAKPILEKYDIPATVFVANGYVEQQQEYWWDELEK
jgi:hypothetical protein